MTPEKLEKILHEEIPITLAMGIQVAEILEDSIKLSAPLAPNVNHKSTAFGGSLYSLCVLTGWSLLYAQLAKQCFHGHIVIQESQIQYLKPVSSDMTAMCKIDNKKAFERSLLIFSKKNKARFSLRTNIMTNKDVAVSFLGKYVIHK